MITNKLTPAARSVVLRAYEFAVRDGAGVIREEHLLTAVLVDGDGGRLLGDRRLGDDALRQVAADLADSRRKGGLTGAEELALIEFGIDVDAVVRQVEEQLGAHALVGGERRRPPWWRKAVFSPQCVQVLAGAERHLAAFGGRSMGIEHLSLALVSTPSALAESLARQGISETTVRAALTEGAVGGARR